MPKTEVVLFAEDDGTSPLLKWLDTLPPKVRVKCLARTERLAEEGHQLRHPEADYLRDGIYELRVSFQRIQYRILYFFQDKHAIISHGLMKQRRIPSKEIDLALERKARFVADPLKHTFEGG